MSEDEGTLLIPNKKPRTLLKQGNIINAQSREIIYNVANYFKAEKEKFKDTSHKDHFSKVHQRAADATGASVGTITKTMYEKEESGKLDTQFRYKCLKPYKQYNFELDLPLYAKIREVITDLYFQNELVTVRSLSEILKSNLSSDQLRPRLREMSFRTVRTESNGFVVCETHRARLRRIEYLEAITKFRSEERPVVFMHECSITDKEKPKLRDPKNTEPFVRMRSGALVMVHVWNNETCEPCGFLFYRLKNLVKDYEKWLRTELIPSLPERAVLVVSHGVNPSHYVTGYPSFSAPTNMLKEWLSEHSIPVPDNTYKAKLYDIILANKDNPSVESATKILQDNGIDLLQIPRYHWGLNPAEYIWPNSIVHVSEVLVPSVVTLKPENMLMTEVNTIAPDVWKNAQQETINLEKTLLENESAMDEIYDIIDVKEELLPESSDEEGFEITL